MTVHVHSFNGCSSRGQLLAGRENVKTMVEIYFGMCLQLIPKLPPATLLILPALLVASLSSLSLIAST